jgi:N-acetylglucosaminyl-diphospho-decaprenol L-rhamnosyltransferase
MGSGHHPPYSRAVVPGEPLLTVAVVSWNTRELLLRCLASLAPDAEAGRAQVWVIDNASEDDSAAAARAGAPWANVLDAGANLGFGRAVNLVAEQTTGPWLLAANADVALEPGALDALLAAGRSARVGCVAPRLILPSGETQHSVHPLPTVPLTLAFNVGAHRLSRRLGERLCLNGFWNPDRPRAVPWAIGACLLLRRDALEEVGGFDARQWMYAEDLDLAWRLREHGWITRYEPRARVLHESSAATAAAFGEEQMSRFLAATYAMLLRRRGAVRMWTTATINIAGAALRAIWMEPLGSVSGRWRGRSADNRRWLKSHLSGVRRASTPAGPT